MSKASDAVTASGQQSATTCKDWQHVWIDMGVNGGVCCEQCGNKPKGKKQVARAEAIAKLRCYFKPGDTAYTILRNVSRSGMSRQISILAVNYDVSYLAAVAMDYRQADNGALKVSGCGMDMGFHVVYGLSSVMWPQGFECIGDVYKCPANDHSNGDRNYSPDHVHLDGGYALRHRWL